MKLGYIDYLNCYPFYYDLFEKNETKDITIVPDYPGNLNRMISDGTLDMGPISSAAFPDIQHKVSLLPGFCLSSIGYVRSVVLISRVPIESLHQKRVGLTSASKTSVLLLKILLEKYYKVSPVYSTVGPEPTLKDLDAMVVIGNEALIENREPVPYLFDLGDLWKRKTGYPVVFAVFAVNDSFAGRHPELVDSIVGSYNSSLDTLKKNPQKIIEKARERYPDIHYDVREYYQLLKFEFTPDLKEALLFYFREAASLGLLPAVKEMKFYKD